LRPLVFINFVMLAILCVVTVFTIPRVPANALLLLGYAAMAALLVLHPRIRLPWFDFPKLFRRVYPVVYIAVIFDSLVHLVGHINPWRGGDELLRRLDLLIFGVDLPLFLESYINPLAVELLTIVYMLYFLLPFVLVIMMWRDGKESEITKWACIISINLYANYLLYFVVPAEGPRLYMQGQFSVPLKGTFAANFLIDLLNGMESNKFDIFPSAHVSATLCTLYGAFKYQRRLAVPFAVIFAGIAVSTVYLRYHYAADLIAGAVLAFGAIYAGNAFYHAWEGRRVPVKSRETLPIGNIMSK